jgi:tetratricopeptide (TPR) repeat protein
MIFGLLLLPGLEGVGQGVGDPSRKPVTASTNTVQVPAALTAQDWMQRAHDAQSKGLMKPALEHIAKAIEASPQDPKPYYYRAQLLERLRSSSLAEADMTRVIELGGTNDPGVFMQRALLRFRLGEFAGCIADFDRYLKTRPSKAAELWQRGIAFYYAGRPSDGVRQFELHRTVNPNDVENSAWHFVFWPRCRAWGAARQQWMEVKGDSRVPMAQIQELMAGRGTAEAGVGGGRCRCGKRGANPLPPSMPTSIWLSITGLPARKTWRRATPRWRRMTGTIRHDG